MFDAVDFAALAPSPWTFPEGATLGEGFRCRRPEFVTYWKKGRIERDWRSGVASVFVLRVDERLAAYVTLLADKLVATTRLLQSEEIRYRTFPAVKLGLLAADRRAKGAGTRMVDWALEYAAFDVASKVGVRFVTVDALYDPDTGFDASPFYERLGFEFASPDDVVPPADGFRTMFYDLRNINAGP